MNIFRKMKKGLPPRQSEVKMAELPYQYPKSKILRRRGHQLDSS